MAKLVDKGNYFEIKGPGITLRVSKNNGTVTDVKAPIVKSDISIVISLLTLSGYKDLANKVASKYRGQFD